MVTGPTDRIQEAFTVVRREGFLPAAERNRASYDGPILIGHGQTNSQPRTVADMLRLLDAQPGDRALDVGAGSGWTTALLAHLTAPDGRVYGVELEPEIAQWGSDNLAREGFDRASLEAADPEVLGLPDHAPYDRILVSAEADTVPRTLVDQLAVDGRMVIPVAGVMMLVSRTGDGVTASEHGYYRFVPLR